MKEKILIFALICFSCHDELEKKHLHSHLLLNVSEKEEQELKDKALIESTIENSINKSNIIACLERRFNASEAKIEGRRSFLSLIPHREELEKTPFIIRGGGNFKDETLFYKGLTSWLRINLELVRSLSHQRDLLKGEKSNANKRGPNSKKLTPDDFRKSVMLNNMIRDEFEDLKRIGAYLNQTIKGYFPYIILLPGLMDVTRFSIIPHDLYVDSSEVFSRFSPEGLEIQSSWITFLMSGLYKEGEQLSLLHPFHSDFQYNGELGGRIGNVCCTTCRKVFLDFFAEEGSVVSYFNEIYKSLLEESSFDRAIALSMRLAEKVRSSFLDSKSEGEKAFTHFLSHSVRQNLKEDLIPDMKEAMIKSVINFLIVLSNNKPAAKELKIQKMVLIS